MPVQRGKKRKRERRRGQRDEGESEGLQTATSRQSGSASRPVKRARWQAPLWFNAMFGTVMVLTGIYVAVTQPHLSAGGRLVILVAYGFLGGLLLARAYRQYRARAQ